MSFIHDRKKVAVSYKNKDYTYAELIKMAKIYATHLEIEKEEFVAIFMENRVEYIGAVLGVWEKKGTCTNLDSSYNAEQLAYVFNDSHPKCIFTSTSHLEVIQEASKLANHNIKILNVDEIDTNIDIKIDEYTIEEPEKESTAVMLYTSGTTGNPKGVMLTYDNLLSNIDAVKSINLVSDKDKVLALLPFHHVLPLVLTMLMPLHYGCFVAILDELSSESIKNHLKKYEISVVIGVPRVWEMFHKGIMNKIRASSLAYKLFKLCKKVKSKTLSKIIFKQIHEGFGGHIRILISGGAKLDSEICDDFNTFGFTLIEGYGLTETSPIISFNRPENSIAGTVGVALPGVKIKLEEDGEIVVKGRNVMKGYYKKPEATAEVIDKDGWFHTGDLGEFFGDHLKIIGRKKEMIVLSNGKNINPSDIEAEIMKGTDLIQEVAITENEAHLIAIVVPNFKLLEEKKIANAKEAIKWEVIDKYNVTAPKYRKILDIVITKEELPKTKLGKLRRFMLKDFIKDISIKSQDGKSGAGITTPKAEKRVSTSKEINSIEFKELAKFIETLHSDIDIIPESHMEIDLGLDSLDIVELITFIENTFGVKIAEEEFARLKTVEDVCVYIKEKGGDFQEAEMNWEKILSEPLNIEMPNSKYVTLGRFLLKPFFSWYIKLKKNNEKLPQTSPVIFAGNHQSMLDAFAFSQTLPSEIMKNTYTIAVALHFDSPIRRYFAKNGNIILVDVNKNLKETLQIAAKVLKDGKNLLIFPEGARTRDGELQEFKKTFAILAKELNIPVVPFAIKGAYELMPYGQKPKSGEMSVTLLDKIEPKDKTIDEIVKITRDSIAENIK